MWVGFQEDDFETHILGNIWRVWCFVVVKMDCYSCKQVQFGGFLKCKPVVCGLEKSSQRLTSATDADFGPNLGFSSVSIFFSEGDVWLVHQLIKNRQLFDAICTKRKHTQRYSEQKYASCILSCTLGLLYCTPSQLQQLVTPTLLPNLAHKKPLEPQLLMIFQRSVLRFHDGNNINSQIWKTPEKEGIF